MHTKALRRDGRLPHANGEMRCGRTREGWAVQPHTNLTVFGMAGQRGVPRTKSMADDREHFGSLFCATSIQNIQRSKTKQSAHSHYSTTVVSQALVKFTLTSIFIRDDLRTLHIILSRAEHIGQQPQLIQLCHLPPPLSELG